MRRTSLSLGLAATLLLSLAVAPAMAAHKETTGSRISLTQDCWDNCGAPQTFPADTPFHIWHGHNIGPGENPAYGKYLFTLVVDDELVAADFKTTTSSPDLYTVAWYFNFPDGMTGTHYFTGHWFAPCDNVNNLCNGLKRNTPVEYLTITVEVTFV